jgi:hypothetical protein
MLEKDQVELNPELEGKWTALYLPARPPGKEDPSRFDFDSREAAEEYLFSYMCKGCTEERERALKGTSDPNNEEHRYDSLWPGCAYEWEVLPTADYARCESFEDIMTATGAKVIYKKD